jgi:hypothetical protein
MFFILFKIFVLKKSSQRQTKSTNFFRAVEEISFVWSDQANEIFSFGQVMPEKYPCFAKVLAGVCTFEKY